jgi:hypothetical protein
MSTQKSAPPWQWDTLLLIVAALVALVVALITGGLVQVQTHEVVTSIISGAVAFGATLKLVWAIMCNFGGRRRNGS